MLKSAGLKNRFRLDHFCSPLGDIRCYGDIEEDEEGIAAPLAGCWGTRRLLLQGVGSVRDIFCGSGFILQMDYDIILLFSKG